MNQKGLLISGGVILVTVFLVVAYSLFNVLGVTQSRVKRNELTIVTSSVEKVYDGESLSSFQWDIESGSLGDGDSIEVEMLTSITNPQTVDNEIGVTILDIEGNNVTLNYNIIYKLGTLRVHPIELRIQTDSASKVYDGEALTNENWSIVRGQLFQGHRMDVVMASALTVPGLIENEIGISIYDESNQIVNNIYDIEYDRGTLEVEGISLLISTDSYEKSYDGTPLLGGEARIRSGQLPASHRIQYSSEQSLTLPGSISNDLVARIFDQNGKDVTSLYDIRYEYGSLRVYAVELVIESASDEKVYDGIPLSNSQWTLKSGSIPENYVLDVDLDTVITRPGIATNTIYAHVLTESGTDVSHLYDIELIEGVLEVLKVELFIRSEDKEKDYDGLPLLGGEGIIEVGELALNHAIGYGPESSITKPGNIENELTFTIEDAVGNNVTDYYSIELQIGTLTVHSSTLIIGSNDAEKVYDGLPLSDDRWSLLFGAVGESEELVVHVDNEITRAGSIENTIVAYVFNEAGTDISDLYSFEYIPGELTVLQKELEISTQTIEKDYDGTPIEGGPVLIDLANIAESDHVIYGSENSITNPGFLNNEIDIRILNEDDIDVTDSYNIISNFGYLYVRPILLVVESDSDSKTYDGIPLRNENYNIVNGALLEGHSLSIDFSNEITNPGSIDNEMDVIIRDESNEDVSYIYDLQLLYGLLRVDEIELAISTKSFEKGYDGSPLLGGEASFDSGNLIEGHIIEYSPENTLTNPASMINDISVIIRDEEGNNVTSYYDISYDYGILTVHPVFLSILSESDTKTYDGTPLSNSNWLLLGGTLLDGHDIDISMNREITNPGMIENTMLVIVRDENDVDVSYLYNIEKTTGTLEVEAVDITVSTDSFTKGYDRTPLLGGEASLISGTLLAGHTLESTSENSLILPGSIENEVTVIIRDEGLNDVTSLYDIQYDYGTLTVQAIDISVSTESFEKGYDGSPLLGGEASLVSGSLLAGHTIEGGAENSILNPGTIENEVTVIIRDDQGSNVTSLYDIDYNYGTLTVHPVLVRLESESDSKVYDGTPLSNNNWQLLQGSLLSGHHFDISIDNEITNPGSISNTMYVIVRDENNVNVSYFYDIVIEFGTLEIQAIDITLSTATFEKGYDATPLFGGQASLLAGSLIAGHTIEYGAEVSINNPGSIVNSQNVIIRDEALNNVSSYYNINYNYGTLTIHPILLRLVSESDSKVYDGTPLSNNNWQLIQGSLLAGHYLDDFIDNEITIPGSIDNSMYVIVRDENDIDVSYFYELEYTFGILRVDPITLIISSGSASKVYDGTPLSDDTYLLEFGTLLPNHNLHINLDSEITDVGETENTIFAYVTDELDQYASVYYNIEYDPGTLQVLSSPYSSNQLSRNSFEPNTEEVFKVYSDSTGIAYFRAISKGDYTMSGFNTANIQNTNMTINPLSIPGSALAEEGLASSSIQIEYLREQVPFLTPYYISDLIAGTNDVYINGNTTIVNDMNIILYNFDEANKVTISNPSISSEEEIYRNYVYDYYLTIPESTKTELLVLAGENSLSPLSDSIIGDVKNYIQNAATYNLDFAPIPDDVEDIVLYFLTESKEGICQHYAAAATLMYRSLGIPARYVEGYVSPLTEGEWTTVTNETAHAWVEVYIDGFGWLSVEVTGGSGGFGEGSGSGGESGESGDSTIPITIKPRTVKEAYVLGKTIQADSMYILGYPNFYSEGYRYEATYTGTLSEIGSASSSVETIVIYDSEDNDVTALFDITYSDGLLQLYDNSIDLYTSSDTKSYDGIALENGTYSTNGSLQEGHVIVDVIFTGSQVDVGSSRNSAILVIHDEEGKDVTATYNVINYFGDLTVTPKYITIESASSSKSFNGSPLTDDSYQVTSGSLALSDIVIITVTGSQTGIGSSMNTIESIEINNGTKDVTANYIIDLVEGELTVTPPY